MVLLMQRQWDIHGLVYIYIYSWFRLLRGPRNTNETSGVMNTPSTKILFSKFHSPLKGTRFFLRLQDWDREKYQYKMNMNYFVELESKEVLKKEWEHLKQPKHGLKGQILQKVFSSTSYSLENVYTLTKMWLWLVLSVVFCWIG